MKGLLIKDYKLILNQKNFFCLMIALSVGMLLFSDDVIFPLGFLIFVISLFTISTISYDDYMKQKRKEKSEAIENAKIVSQRKAPKRDLGDLEVKETDSKRKAKRKKQMVNDPYYQD